jgi:hypothetical protein
MGESSIPGKAAATHPLRSNYLPGACLGDYPEFIGKFHFDRTAGVVDGNGPGLFCEDELGNQKVMDKLHRFVQF